MIGKIEKTYGRIFKYTLKALNPLKKAVITTECNIHKFINKQALNILKNDGFTDAFTFFSDYIVQINRGVVWADQDFKSSGHFYSPVKRRGLFGNRDAMSLAEEYYDSALKYWKEGSVDESMFYLGASVHLVQDMTVPQHANIRLLDDHRQYENFIKRTYLSTPVFSTWRGGYYLGSIEEYIKFNARNSMIIFGKLKDIKEDEKRFFSLTKFTLPLAQKTTAGCMLMFYRKVGRKR